MQTGRLSAACRKSIKRDAAASLSTSDLHTSPHLAAIRLRPHHRIACLTLERFTELGEVRQRSVDAVFRDGVRVALDHGALRFRARLVAAPLAPCDEELLFGSEAVNGRFRALAFARLLVRAVGDLGAS